MTTGESRPKRVLLVDDEAAFLEAVGPAFAQWSQNTWEVYVASDVGKALSQLQAVEMDLAVVDVRMPVIDGVQFLRLLNRKYPNLQKVVLTGYASDTYRSACLEEGAELFLEKPRSPEGLQSIFTALNELLKWHPESGFRGVLRRVGLQDVLQMECLSRNSVVLEVTAAGVRAAIFVQDGQIVHAQIGGLEGEAAFQQILALAGGQFQLQPFYAPPRISIEGQWEFLLMEAARKRDEAQDPSATDNPPPESTPDALSPVDASADAPGADRTGSRGGLRTDRWDQEPEAAVGSVAPSFTTSIFPGAQDKGRMYPTKIEEMLLTSAQGEVLYQWRCPDPDERIGFLEFLSQRSRQLTLGLPLGRFDRLEMETPQHRVVVQIQADRGVLVRSGRGALTLQSPSFA